MFQIQFDGPVEQEEKRNINKIREGVRPIGRGKIIDDFTRHHN
jgi:hypothetical protein